MCPVHRMEPDPGKVFLSQKAESQIEELLERHMKDLTYDPTTAGQIASTVSSIGGNRYESQSGSNGTHLGLFHIRFQYILAPRAKMYVILI